MAVADSTTRPAKALGHLMLDFSRTLMRYAGSHLDEHMPYFFSTTDQLITLGPDFPEYSPASVLTRFQILSEGIELDRIENILYRNLEHLFSGYSPPMDE